MSKVIDDLYEHIRENGGVSVWATKLGMADPTLYAKLRGRRRIHPDEARKFEKLTRGRFSREKIIFGDAA